MNENQLLDDFKPIKPKVEQQVEQTENLPSTPQGSQISNVTRSTAFTDIVDDAKINVVKEAAATDVKFIEEFKKELKEATMKSAQLEREKQQLEIQNVQYHQELLDKEQQLNKLHKTEDKWENKQKRRQFHYDGVKPIMEWVGIKFPMNLFLLYFLTAIITFPYLLGKLVKGTFGNLICGAEDANRSKAMRGFLWTILAVTITVLLAMGVYALGHYVFQWF